MREALSPKPDLAVSGNPAPLIWVLAQTSPTFKVLAASDDRERLRSELAELYGCDHDGGRIGNLRFAISPTNRLFAR